MGEPVKIIDLAKRMIMLAGLIPDKDIDIRFTGLREGEKLYEELFKESEALQATHHPKIMVAKKSLKYDDFNNLLTELIQIQSQGETDNQKIKNLMKQIIPEYENLN